MNRLRTNSIARLLAPGSLRYQLLNRSLLILAALLLLIGVLQYVIMKDFVFKNKAESLNAQVMSMPMDWFMDEATLNEGMDGKRSEQGNATIDNAPSDRPSRNHRDSPMFYQPGLSIVLIGQDGTITDVSKDTTASAPLLSEKQYGQISNQLQARKQVDYQIVDNAQGKEQLVVFRLAGPPGRAAGIIQVSTETDSLKQLLMTQLAIFTGLSALALAAGLALYLPLLRRTLRPLSHVVLAVQHTDAGSLTKRIPASHGQEEIDRLSEAFNGMLERLDISFESERKTTEKMRRFIADASHELRTPLTSIHGFLEVLLRGAASNPDQLHRALTSMQLESRRINKLVEDLLALAKLDQDPQLQLADTRLDELLREMEPQLQLIAGSRKVELAPLPRVSGRFHADKLKQVVLNLFLNAVQHTDSESGTISISLAQHNNQAELTVADNGIGIQAEHLPHLFERFYRSESSRTRKNGGAGLGLSITQSIVDAHQGIIEVTSHPNEGTTFRIVLPTDL
ncbi:sensor histidine kinase [Paenibacillus sp. PL91]|uniref:sensor histidine kinase n=1 Tax=Paenibacillus sp. PL91 TaxID=2729538 RepID=UPI00145D5717|nr:HAMP domain-containing sensor histidine kinase [Paenibacillus sp. PL91]MBC9202688.1 HAMP domain-containing protein [Paenibacillus sp. PL91]